MRKKNSYQELKKAVVCSQGRDAYWEILTLYLHLLVIVHPKSAGPVRIREKILADIVMSSVQ